MIQKQNKSVPHCGIVSELRLGCKGGGNHLDVFKRRSFKKIKVKTRDCPNTTLHAQKGPIITEHFYSKFHQLFVKRNKN